MAEEIALFENASVLEPLENLRAAEEALSALNIQSYRQADRQLESAVMSENALHEIDAPDSPESPANNVSIHRNPYLDIPFTPLSMPPTLPVPPGTASPQDIMPRAMDPFSMREGNQPGVRVLDKSKSSSLSGSQSDASNSDDSVKSSLVFQVTRINRIPRLASQTQKPIFTTEGLKLPENLNPQLLRPRFCPRADRHQFATASADQSEEFRHQNILIIGELNETCSDLAAVSDEECENKKKFGRGPSYINGKKIFTSPITDHARSLCWIGPTCLAVAAGSHISLFWLNDDFDIGEIINFPEFHFDDIRDIACCETSPNVIASGGFDGTLQISDVYRMQQDVISGTATTNGVFDVTDVISSVCWLPQDPCLVSCTTDSGVINAYDIRQGHDGAYALHHDTGRAELFCHAYRDSDSLILGFGNGQIQILDLRILKEFQQIQDPFQSAIGEIAMDRSTRRLALSGQPGVSLWEQDRLSMQMFTSASMCSEFPIPEPDKEYYTTASFIPGTPFVGLTDSTGQFGTLRFPLLGDSFMA